MKKSIVIVALFCTTLWAQRPNIVFILTDDLDSRLFNDDEKLPALLRAKGMSFSNHFAPLALCCPSRVSTLRGQFPHNTTIFTNTSVGDGGFQGTFKKGLEKSTIAVWLKNAGYRTALLGKYLNGYPVSAPSKNYIPPGWTYWLSPNGGKWQSQYNYSLNDNGQTIHYGQKPEDYLGDVLSKKAVEFIKDSKENFGDQPFFLFLNPTAPHKPAIPPPRYENRYKDLKAPRTPSFNENELRDKPEWVRNKAPLSAQQIEDMDALYKNRKASLLGTADMLEAIIITLEELNELDNTYIFFSSDNGFHQGQHRLVSGKTTAYEEDIEIPLVVRGPKIAPSTTIDALTANVDYAPTFAEIAGIQIPDFVDGRSMLPFLKGEAPKSWREMLLLEFGGPISITRKNDNPLFELQDPFDIELLRHGNHSIPAYIGLRTNHPLTYIHYANGENELYFLARDPHQMNNAYKKTSQALKEKLNNAINELRTAKGAALRDKECFKNSN